MFQRIILLYEIEALSCSFFCVVDSFQVRLASVVDVQRAVADLNGSLLMGQAIVVQEDNSFLKDSSRI